jgi:hypothetical protein
LLSSLLEKQDFAHSFTRDSMFVVRDTIHDSLFPIHDSLFPIHYALLKTVEIVISSEGDKVAGVEKSIKNRFLRFVRPDLSGLTTVEMTSFQQSIFTIVAQFQNSVNHVRDFSGPAFVATTAEKAAAPRQTDEG